VQDRPLAEIGGKGLFTKELDEAMEQGAIDLAVHSMKDVPTYLPDFIRLPCMVKREDVRDAFISPIAKTPDDLPLGAKVGTASLRRGAQLLNRRPDLQVVNFRGNVQTRLNKLAEGQVDATLLAAAGLNRLGLSHHATSLLSPDFMLPAVAQGAVGVTCRSDDVQAHEFLAPLNHAETMTRVTAERAFLTRLDGSCRTPIAALAELNGDDLSFRGLIVSPDGKTVHRVEGNGKAANAWAIGDDAGQLIKAVAGPDFFKA
jgi:hydroxymethylbilane synthase